MHWLIWLGTIVFAVTVVGLLYLRNRPLYDLDGNVVDRDGLRVPTRDRLIRLVLTELLDANAAPTSAYALRQRLQLSGPTFYPLMSQLEVDQLVSSYEVTADDVGTPSFRNYRLTDRGLAEALHLSTRRRHN